MPYTPYHADWKDHPDTTTPITAAALEYIEAGIVSNAGATGATGATGAAGSGGASIVEYQLAAGVSAGNTTFTIDRSPSGPVYSQQYIIIGAYTATAEIRKLNNAPAGVTLTVAPLGVAHSSGSLVLVVNGTSLPTTIWGCAGDGTTDDTVALQQAFDQTAIYGGSMWVDGLNRTHAVTAPLVMPGTKLRHIFIQAKPSYTPAETTNAMIMSSQGSIKTFTADPATDTITTPEPHLIPSDGILVMFKGTSLPTGLTGGKVYYAYNRTANTFQVSATLGGAIVNITAAGSGGTVYSELQGLERVYLDDVYVKGDITIPNMNGLFLYLQQPAYTNKLRTEAFTGTGLRLNGQISNHYNAELNGMTTGDGSTALDIRGSGHNFFGLNIVHGSYGVRTLAGESAINCNIYGLWTENVTKHISFEGTTLGFGLHGWFPSLGGGTQDGLVVDAALSPNVVGYHFSDLRVSTAQAVVKDNARSLTVYASDLPQGCTQMFIQQPGAVCPWVPPPPPVGTTSNYSIKIFDDVIRTGNATVARTMTLPTAVGIAGKRYTIKIVVSGTTTTLATTGGQTIDGAATYSLPSLYDKVTVMSNNANWEIV